MARQKKTKAHIDRDQFGTPHWFLGPLLGFLDQVTFLPKHKYHWSLLRKEAGSIFSNKFKHSSYAAQPKHISSQFMITTMVTMMEVVILIRCPSHRLWSDRLEPSSPISHPCLHVLLAHWGTVILIIMIVMIVINLKAMNLTVIMLVFDHLLFWSLAGRELLWSKTVSVKISSTNTNRHVKLSFLRQTQTDMSSINFHF